MTLAEIAALKALLEKATPGEIEIIRDPDCEDLFAVIEAPKRKGG